MVNKHLFKSFVYGKGDNLTACAEIIETSSDNLSKKLNGKSKFTVDQIEKFVRHYGCTSEETMAIFFEM